MNKTWIVYKSEFLRRVRSKWFIISTLLAPVMIIAITVLPAVLGVSASENAERRIAVFDSTGVLLKGMQEKAQDSYDFVEAEGSLDDLRAQVMAGDFNGYLVIPASVAGGEGEASYYSVEGTGLSGESRIRNPLNQALENFRLAERNVPDEVRAILSTTIEVETLKLTETGTQQDGAAFYGVLGYIMGFIIYIATFVYGAYVLQGVLEEKTSRVVEVMVSSVRPFQMLMGKVLGIGSLGLVQLAMWSLIMLAMVFFAGSIIAMFVDPASLQLPADASTEAILAEMEFSIPPIDPMIFAWFILFFLGGYMLYSSFFAAVGSVVETQQDAQGLLAPIYMLVILPITFVIFIVETPNSGLAVGLSMVPFFSPILMVVRVAVTEVPLWQVGLSLFLLIGSFVISMWMCSRIYRIGILMYGKKANLKEMWRWMLQS